MRGLVELPPVRRQPRPRAAEVTGRSPRADLEVIDPDRDVAVLLGQVKPSLFLAIFMTILAATGLVCLGVVLGTLIPDLENLWLWSLIISPIAGIFYWRGVPRERKVSLQLLPDAKLKVRAHKDEIEELQRSLNLQKIDS